MVFDFFELDLHGELDLLGELFRIIACEVIFVLCQVFSDRLDLFECLGLVCLIVLIECFARFFFEFFEALSSFLELEVEVEFVIVLEDDAFDGVEQDFVVFLIRGECCVVFVVIFDCFF